MPRLRFAPRPRCLLVALAILSTCNIRSFAENPAPPAPRLTGTFEGIECEYSPGREDLARAVAHRFVLYNEAFLASQEEAKRKKKDLTTVPLTPEEMRAHRDVYLGRIASLLAMKKPTSLQLECYDAFVDNYEQTMRTVAFMYGSVEKLQVVKRLTLWDRAELAQRLEQGEKIAGFRYDAQTKQGGVTYGANFESVDERLKELGERRKKLRRDYQLKFDTENGVTTYRATVKPKAAETKPDAEAAKSSELVSAPDKTEWFPVIVPADLKDTPVAELADKLWNGLGNKSAVNLLLYMESVRQRMPVTDPTIAFLVLHETIEVGIGDQYFRGKDRRWFCDGVANYGAWRILRDLHGEPTATKAHDLKASLTSYADMREQADLRKWAATEDQSTEEQNSRLNSARYAFAEQAVFLMNERGGQDVLPKLFKEIGKTKPAKVSMSTVEKAWTTVTGSNLDTILADAVKPPTGIVP